MPSQPAIACPKLAIEILEQRCEICSKLRIKPPKRCPKNFEQVNAGWVTKKKLPVKLITM